ncbi:hypothetical protein SAMN04487983_105017 [Streptomyces sp. yr375]|uniref:hypothetical protein n=1 Tax=Streptomyces sp. yr375 TaxID=1761906 RepID=UPI0008C02DA4|nr:hypothetical protein [Streptomyces sp. yr375]SES40993.1 hypothetical protein SAMN04487983_105017 [Streptomyces sp. yr375]
MVDRSPISDDEWRAFVEESERGAAASAPKEPSARARMVTERLRGQGEPEGWRTGPASRELDGRAGRRRKLWSVLGVALALGVVVVSIKPSLLPGDPFSMGEPEVAAGSPLPAETAAPTGAPAPAPEQVPTIDRPFAGSPALSWADGEAGIVLPAATAVGSASKQRVTQALELTRKLLVGANLDPKTLRGERPAAALSLLDPKQPDLLNYLNTSLRSPDEKNDPLTLFSRFDPDEVRIVGDVVKTRGRMTFKKGEFAGVAVHADYTFVYPVRLAEGSNEVTRTIVRRVIDVELPDPAHYDVTAGRLVLHNRDQQLGNSACDVYDGFLHPEFRATASAGPDPTGPTKDPYDRSKGVGEGDASDSCGTVSRV